VTRKIAEVTLAKLRAQFLTPDEVASEWKRTAGIVRRGVMSYPDRVGAALPHLTPHDVDTLRLLAQEVLTLCSEELDGVLGADPSAFLPETAGVSP